MSYTPEKRTEVIISAPKTVKNCLRKPNASINAGVTWNKKVKPAVTLNTWQLSGLISHGSEKLSKIKRIYAWRNTESGYSTSTVDIYPGMRETARPPLSDAG